MTAGYAFTDMRAKGRTIPYVIVDIAHPPDEHVNAFNAYVALSRSSGRETIGLLRDFDDKLFTVHPSEFLRKDRRIHWQELNELTSTHRCKIRDSLQVLVNEGRLSRGAR